MASGSGTDISGNRFLIARNPQQDSSLPYLLKLPLEGGLILKARDTWPRFARIYCHRYEEPWPEGAEIVEECNVASCRRRGPAIDLVLDRPQRSRSQFVFTQIRGRSAIFWQTQKAARSANPGARVPRHRAASDEILILVDTRERYGFKFSAAPTRTEKAALPAGDYGIRCDDALVAVVERKSLENLISSLSDGTLSFQLQKLSEIPHAAVVVEGRYSDLFKNQHASGAWLADVLARLQLRYPEVPIVFADQRRFAEDWTFRFLSSAKEDGSE